jgi:hypothetical protein
MDADIQKGINFPINFIGNYFRAGPQGSAIAGIKLSLTGSVVPEVYVEGNIGPKRDGITTTNEELVLDKGKTYVYYSPPHARNPSDAMYPVTVSTCNSDPAKGGACDAYDKVVVQALAGNNRGLDASGNLFVRQDAVDRRIFEEVKAKQGKIIDAPGINTCWASDSNGCSYLTAADYTKYGIPESEIDFSDNWFSGWPVIASGTGYTDTDHDGMSDSWETSNGLDLNNAADGRLDKDGDGYTNLEEFINGESSSGNSPACTDSDWQYSDGACQPSNTMTRTWTKTGACSGGVNHLATEPVSCTYSFPVCTDSDWSFSDGACQSSNTLTRTWLKTGNCQDGAYHQENEQVSCTFVAPRKTEDVNGDGTVNMNDVIVLLQDFGKSGSFANEYSDANQDGRVNLNDIVLIAKNFGK